MSHVPYCFDTLTLCTVEWANEIDLKINFNIHSSWVSDHNRISQRSEARAVLVPLLPQTHQYRLEYNLLIMLSHQNQSCSCVLNRTPWMYKTWLLYLLALALCYTRDSTKRPYSPCRQSPIATIINSCNMAKALCDNWLRYFPDDDETHSM